MELRQRHSITRSGFTLTEVLIVIGILAVIVGVSVSGLMTSRERAAQSKDALLMQSAVTQAQQRAQTAREGRGWGVECQSNHVQLFSFNSTTVDYREQTDFRSGVACSTTGSQVRFTKLSGQPVAETVFTLAAHGKLYRKISITQPGLIQSEAL